MLTQTPGAQTPGAPPVGDPTAIGPSTRAYGGRFAQILLALLLPIGPAAVALLRFVLPYNTSDSPPEMVQAVYSDPAGQSAVLWLGLVAVLALVPAVIVIGHLTLPRARVLTVIAVPLAVLGFLSLPWMVAGDMLLWTGAAQHIDQSTITQLYSQTHPTSDVAAGLFVLGHVLGTIGIGLALGRSHVVGWLPAAAVIIAQPVHILAVIVSSHPLDLVGWGLNAVGFAAVTFAMLRRPAT